MIKSLVSLGDLDLIFKVTMRHTQVSKQNNDFYTKPIEPDGEFYWIYMNIFYVQDKVLIGDLDLFASVTTRRKMSNANLCFELLHDN